MAVLDAPAQVWARRFRAASVHYGTATEIRTQRGATLDAAYTANPARFHHRRPVAPQLPTDAWINNPRRDALITSQ